MLAFLNTKIPADRGHFYLKHRTPDIGSLKQVKTILVPSGLQRDLSVHGLSISPD